MELWEGPVLIARDYRKFVSQGVAYIAFRWIIIWFIIAVCASKGQRGIAVALALAGVDVIAEGASKATVFAIEQQSRQDWRDRLTNRCFYKLLFERIRDGHSSGLDVEELFAVASKDALADIERANRASAADAGFLDTTAWHWFGGIISFLWRCVSFGVYYGSALYLGSGGSF
jgi:hypothetical protein